MPHVLRRVRVSNLSRLNLPRALTLIHNLLSVLGWWSLIDLNVRPPLLLPMRVVWQVRSLSLSSFFRELIIKLVLASLCHGVLLISED